MKKFRCTPLLLLMVLCGGCGSFLASIDSEPIKDDPGKRTYGAKVEDEAIETKGKVNINASDAGFKSGHFSVISYNGYVLIAGQVPTAELKEKAAGVVREIRGVRRIYNELEVSENTSAWTRSNDTWLTTKLKSSLLADSEIESGRVKIVTENGVIYLMGLASHAEAERITDAASTSTGVRKVVQLFEYID